MRIPIPSRFTPKYVLIFMSCMFVGQLAEGTDFLFAVLTVVYIALWAAAYNVAGGLSYPSGAFVLSNGLFSVVIGYGAKVVLFEPGQRNMQAPIVTLSVYTLGMAMTLLVVSVVRSLRPPKGLLRGFDSLEQLHQASITCLVAGVTLVVLTGNSGTAGSALSALRQLNQFPIMAVLLGTTYTIRATEGRRSANWVVVCSIGIYVSQGLLNFGKEGMTIGFVAWGIAAMIEGYNFKRLQVAGLLCGAMFFSYYLVPYSQYVRIYKSQTGSTSENFAVALEYLGDLPNTRRLYLENIAQVDIESDLHFFDQREGFLDRLVQIAGDDELIDFTQQGHVFGLTPTLASYVGIIPHFIWPGKPEFNTGNIYAHEMGWLSEDDTSTGISFAAAADAFHQASWLGVLILLPVDLFLCFMIFDTVAGSAKYSPFALFPIIQLFQQGAAGGLSAVVYAFTYTLLALLLISWTTKTAAPFVLNTILPRRAAPLAVAPHSLSTSSTAG